MSSPLAHHLNRLFTSIAACLFFMLVPYLGRELTDFVRDYRTHLTLNSPFVTDSHFYHPGDAVRFTVERNANFSATFAGTRLLERTYPGTGLREVILREPISGGIEPNPPDRQRLGYLAHPELPVTLASQTGTRPLEPGIYRFRYPTTYAVFNRIHNSSSRTHWFRVLPADAEIREGMAVDAQLKLAEQESASDVD